MVANIEVYNRNHLQNLQAHCRVVNFAVFFKAKIILEFLVEVMIND